MTMRLIRPAGLLEGYQADAPCERVPWLVHVGEQLAPASFPITTHPHEFWEVYLQLDGLSVWEAEGRRWTVAREGAFLAPPGRPHGLVCAEGPHHFAYAGVRLEATEAWPFAGDAARARSCRAVARGERLRGPFRTLLREATVRDEAGLSGLREVGLRSAVEGLAVETARAFGGVAERGGSELPPRHPAVERALALLEGSLGRTWALGDLAALCGVSAGHLGRVFRAETGRTPYAAHLAMRLDAAEEMLRATGLSVGRVAEETGFGNARRLAQALAAAGRPSARSIRDGRILANGNDLARG